MHTIEQPTGQKVAAPEDVAFERGFIDREQLVWLGEELSISPYGRYLLELAGEV